MPKFEMNFTTALKRFTTSTANSMKYAEMCSIMAIEHFAKHGSLALAQQFYDACPKNYVRKNAFVFWLAAHSPVVLADGKFTKDKAEDAKEFNLDGAKAKKFWEFAPDKEIVNYTGQEFIGQVLRLVTKHENADRMIAADEDAVAMVAAIKQVAQKHVKVNAA